MHTIKTAKGKTYNISGAAVGSIDGCFRAWLLQGGVSELVEVFTDATETAVLTVTNDGRETKYTGYTVFRGISIERNGEIMITLARGD